jgi:Flp pilus assembly protein TadB
MRLQLLRPVKYTVQGQIRQPSISEAVNLKWLLLCFLAPLSWWFFAVGLVATFFPVVEYYFSRKANEESFEKEFHEYLLYLMLLPEGMNMYESMELAATAVTNEDLSNKIGELRKSLLIDNVAAMDLTNTSESFRGFVGLLRSHQEIGLNLADTLEKLTTLVEDKFYMKKRSEAKKKPVIFTYVQAAVVGALFVYMFYPLGVTIIRNLTG